MIHLFGFRRRKMSDRHVTNITCQKIHKKIKEDKTLTFDLSVHWSDGKKTNIVQQYTAIFDFVQQLKLLYPEYPIPEIRAAKWFESLWKARKEEKKRAVEEFFQTILNLPESVVKGKEVCDFFEFSWPESATRECTHQNSEKSEPSVNKASLISCEGEYESVDDGLIGYSSLSLKPKDVSVFKKEPSEEVDCSYWAVVGYTKRKSGEVDLKEGAAVSVLQRELSGWWFVHVEDTDEQGWAPASCLLPDDQKHLEDYTVSGPFGEFRVLKDFEATEPDEVSCAVGENVEVIQASLDGWWEVRCKGKVGRIPGTHLEPVFTQKNLRNSLYHQIGIYKKYSPPPRRNSKLSVEELYSKVDKFMKKDLPEKQSPNSADTKKDSQLSAKREEKNGGNRHDDEALFYVNSADNVGSHAYVNVELKPAEQKTPYEITHYKVKESYKPNANHNERPPLIAETGDIIESHSDRPGEVYGRLFLQADGTRPEPREGWISKSLLEPYELRPQDVAMATRKPLGSEKSTCSAVKQPLSSAARKSAPVKPIPPKRTDSSLKDQNPQNPHDLSLDSSKGQSVKGSKPVIASKQCLSEGKNPQHQKSSSDFPKKEATGRSINGTKPEITPKPQLLEGKNPQGYEVSHPKNLVSSKPSNRKDASTTDVQPVVIHKISRSECEKVLLKLATFRQFLFRESTQVGSYVLSLRMVDRIHHFPIVLTPEKKYFIGNYNFDSLLDVINYYKENPLLESEDGTGVLLGTMLEVFQV